MYHVGYDQRNEAIGNTVKSPVLMTFSGEDRNPVIDPRSGLPPPSGGGICMYQVPVTVNSDSSTDNNRYSCMWEKPRNPGADATGRNMMGMSYRDKWEQLRSGGSTSHNDITLPHHSSAMMDTDLEDYRKDAYRSPLKDRSNTFGSHSDSALDDHSQIRTPDSHPVSPSRLKFASPLHSRTVAPLDTPKTPCSAMTPIKVSTPIHDKSPPHSSQPTTWFGDTDHDASDLCKRAPIHRQNENPRHEWSNVEVPNTNRPELIKCQRTTHGTAHCRMNYARDNGLVSNVLLGVLCLMMSSFGLVLLLRLTYRSFEGTQIQSGDSLLTSNSSYTILKDIAVGLSALVVFLNVWCILTMAIISYLAARLLKCHNGDQRASEFIHQCEVTRVAAAAGAFVSIPVFMLGLLLYTIVDYSFVSAVICVVILSSGTTCTIITIIHSTCTWHQQKSMTILQQDPAPLSSSTDAQNAHESVQNHAVNYFELSTLV